MEAEGRAARFLREARRVCAAGSSGPALCLLERGLEKALEETPPGQWTAFLAPACSLAAIYRRPALARRWARRALARLRSRAGAGGAVQREVELLYLRALFAAQGPLRLEARLERAFRRLERWPPWAVEFRLLVLLNAHRMKEIADLLRSPPPGSRPSRGTVEYAARLKYLGICFALQRRFPQASRVLESARRKAAECRAPEALYHLAQVLCWQARLHAEAGSRDEALAAVRAADAVLRRHRFADCRYLRDATCGYVHSCAGDHEQAFRENLATCLAARPRTASDRAHLAHALLNAARFSIVLGKRDRSRRLLARARSLVRLLPFPGLRSYLELVRGDLARERGTAGGFGEALRAYRRAERTLQGGGAAHEWWLSQVHLSRALCLLRQRRFAEGLRQARLGQALGRRQGSLVLQAESLLLQSSLLHERKAPRAEIYETILRHLGVVREPVTLFKILANLYIYSWDLADGLELTDLHLKQLHGLRERLPRRLFDRLYRAHVAARVMARARKLLAAGRARSGAR